MLSSLLMMLAWACPPTATVVNVSSSQVDARGSYTLQLQIPDQPAAISSAPLHREFCAQIPAGLTIRRVRSFVAFSAGTIAEFALTVTAGTYYLVTRSEHKEVPTSYDAWKTEKTEYRTDIDTPLVVYVDGWSTNGQAYMSHVGVILEVQK